MFYCDTPGCVLTFRSENDAQAHMDTGEHTLVLERESVYDSVRRKWAQHVTEVVSRTVEPSASSLLPGVYPSPCDDDAVPLQGWALKVQKTATKTSENAKAFLIAKLNEGLRSGKRLIRQRFQKKCKKPGIQRDCHCFHLRNGKQRGK